jgi:hypothetical protein
VPVSQEVKDWLGTLGWVLIHEDAGGMDEDRLKVADDNAKVGRPVPGLERLPSYSVKKGSAEMTFGSVEQLLNAVREHEAAQRPL